MKQTAVEFLQECLSIHLSHQQQMQFEGLFQQAKEMEKEQMRLADKNGRDRNQYKHDTGYGGVEYWDNEPKSFEDYYNETFNTKER